MKHALVLIVLLLAAGVFVITGSATGAVALVGIGLLLELGFWFGVFQRRRHRE